MDTPPEARTETTPHRNIACRHLSNKDTTKEATRVEQERREKKTETKKKREKTNWTSLSHVRLCCHGLRDAADRGVQLGLRRCLIEMISFCSPSYT